MVSKELLELSRMFPKIIKADRCDKCAERDAREEARRKELIEQHREQSAREARLEVIPPEMMRTVTGYPTFNLDLWLKIKEWQPSRLKWLGVVGGAGECKTRCIAMLAMRLIRSGHRLTWTTAVEFQDRVDETIRGDRSEIKEAQKYFQRCKSTGVLVLDDFGKNTWNPTVERHLFGLIDYRKTHDLPMLWTANTPLLEILATAGLSKDRGAPMIGRLIEASTIEKV